MSKRLADDELEPTSPRSNTPLTPKRTRFDSVEDEDDSRAALPVAEKEEKEEEEEDEDNENAMDIRDATQSGPADGFSDLYLDTIDRLVYIYPGCWLLSVHGISPASGRCCTFVGMSQALSFRAYDLFWL
jgi:hypothetical protein